MTFCKRISPFLASLKLRVLVLVPNRSLIYASGCPWRICPLQFCPLIFNLQLVLTRERMCSFLNFFSSTHLFWMSKLCSSSNIWPKSTGHQRIAPQRRCPMFACSLVKSNWRKRERKRKKNRAFVSSNGRMNFQRGNVIVWVRYTNQCFRQSTRRKNRLTLPFPLSCHLVKPNRWFCLLKTEDLVASRKKEITNRCLEC